MSKHYSLLFIWSKGAKTRRKILRIISTQQNKGNPIYTSAITKIYNESVDTEESVTISSIRKHVKLLKEYKIIQAINDGGRPEYLELTKNGDFVLSKLKIV